MKLLEEKNIKVIEMFQEELDNLLEILDGASFENTDLELKADNLYTSLSKLI